MISSLVGTVAGFSAGAVELDVAGVGYLVNVTPALMAELRLGERMRILIHMVVRQDCLTLFGFADAEQRHLFVTLLSVSGVGPKLALALTGSMPVESFRTVIASGDVASLTAVAGVGKRGAERIILEMKGKIGLPAAAGADSRLAEVREALAGLGYAPAEVRPVLERVLSGAGDDAAVEDMVRAALVQLAQR